MRSPCRSLSRPIAIPQFPINPFCLTGNQSNPTSSTGCYASADSIRFRRLTPAAGRPSEGLFSEPTAVVQPLLGGPFMPVTRPDSTLEWLQLTLEHPLVGADQVPRRLAKDGAPTILHSAPEVFVTPSPAARRIVRRADHVRQVEKRVTHREASVPHRLHPPCVDAGEKVRMSDKMLVERRLVDDLAARDVKQDRVLFHQVEFAGADQSLGSSRQRGTDDEDIGSTQHLVEAVSRRDPVGRLV